MSDLLDAAISPAVMADMLFVAGLSPEDVAEDHVLRSWMGKALASYRVRSCCAPNDLPAVRFDLNRFCRGEKDCRSAELDRALAAPRPFTSYAELDAGVVSPAGA